MKENMDLRRSLERIDLALRVARKDVDAADLVKARAYLAEADVALVRARERAAVVIAGIAAHRQTLRELLDAPGVTLESSCSYRGAQALARARALLEVDSAEVADAA